VAIDPQTLSLIAGAVEARSAWIGEPHDSAIRLFNGFYEGAPDLVLDLYARTLVIHDYASAAAIEASTIDLILTTVLGKIPWIEAAVLKARRADKKGERRGKLVFGETADRQVREHGVLYAVDLMLSQDTGLYLDTRGVRLWARDHLGGKSALNTFAYTGSYGVAALAGGARQVVQLDASRRFLDLAKASYALNNIPAPRQEDFLIGDFFVWVSRLKRTGVLFDCVFLDPPYFAQNPQGTVDMLKRSDQLVNKIRPLIADGGMLVLVVNALFLSGKEFLETIESLCVGGYLALETIVPVPEDVTGYPDTRLSPPPVDPSPFNHPTKIVILRVRRKT
jgi:23S rRNA (cytosine1962-C5)-methyltransferase